MARILRLGWPAARTPSAGELRGQHIAVVQRRDEQVVAHGREVQQRAEEHKAVPDGVRKRYDAVALEEDDAGDVDGTADGHLVNTRVLALTTNNTHDSAALTVHQFSHYTHVAIQPKGHER